MDEILDSLKQNQQLPAFVSARPWYGCGVSFYQRKKGI